MSEQMATLVSLSDEQRDTIRRIAEKHGAHHVRVFGAVRLGLKAILIC